MVAVLMLHLVVWGNKGALSLVPLVVWYGEAQVPVVLWLVKDNKVVPGMVHRCWHK
jgi:hypothetical protein